MNNQPQQQPQPVRMYRTMMFCPRCKSAQIFQRKQDMIDIPYYECQGKDCKYSVRRDNDRQN